MSKGTSAANKVKGWAGLFLSLVPVLHAIPVPQVQAVIAPLSDFIITLLGLGGAGLLASSPALIGKSSNPQD